MNKINYQKALDEIIDKLNGKVPTILLHSCCAPCSSYCIDYLSKYFLITVFYYNPNIDCEEEFNKRVDEQRKLISQMQTIHKVKLVVCPYDNKDFQTKIKGLEKEKEGGARCSICFNLRLEKTAQFARLNKFDYFTTTLTISPLKDAQRINTIGAELAQTYNTNWLPSDFKKNEGYKKSIEFSHLYDLYRQDYCGCEYSKIDN